MLHRGVVDHTICPIDVVNVLSGHEFQNLAQNVVIKGAHDATRWTRCRRVKDK